MATKAPMQQGQGFDIEVVLAEFALDQTISSFEVPHLSTGQRKHVKKVVEQHTEFQCDSYGFGPERRLALFKGGISGVASMHSPPKISSVDKRVAVEHDGDNRSECSTDAPSTNSSIRCPASSSPLEDYREVLSFPLGIVPPLCFEVRNTFVHFDTRPVSERRVQSMPPDMFRQSLWREALERTLPSPPAAIAPARSMPTSVLKTQATLGSGTAVVIVGLVKAPAFNGLIGTVHSFDLESGRYDILLTTLVGANKLAKVKRANLHLVELPPAPRHLATVVLDEDFPASTFAPEFVSTPTWEERSQWLTL